MKIIIRLLVVLIVLALIALALGFVYADRLAKRGIEQGASYALGVPTTLQSADVGVLSGHFAMTGLSVSNPPGFDRPHFLRLDRGGVAVTWASLRTPTVRLPRLALGGVDLNLQRAGGQSNYQVILDNLKRFEGRPSSEPADETKKRFIIDEVDIEDVQIHVDLLPVGGEQTRVDVPIESIRLTGVGSDSDRGVVLAELVNVLIKAILQAATARGIDLPADLAADLQRGLAQLQGLDDIGVELQDRLSGAAEGAKETVEKLGKEAEEAVKGLGNLLGGDKDG